MTGDIEKVICEERDTYMAYELQKVTKNYMEDVDGSPKPPVVVAVVGLAHVGGILEKIDKVTDQDVAEITQVSPLYASIAIRPVGINEKGFVNSNFGMFLLLDYCIENERGSVGTPL